MADYIQTLSPADLVGRYAWLSDPAHAAEQTTKYGALSDSDVSNLFNYNVAKKSLGRNPTEEDIVQGPGIITDAYLPGILAKQQADLAAANAPAAAAPPTSSVDTSGGVMAPATSTPGGSPTSFASQYSFGSAPTTFAAPPSDNSGVLFLVLGGAVILYFTVFHHG